jgi:predicted amidohydrolase
LHAVADLFCELYDGLDEAAVRRRGEAWAMDKFLKSAADGVAGEVRSGTPVAQIRRRLEVSADVEWQRYACLLGIDRAFMSLNPALQAASEPIPAALQPLAMHVVAHGRLDSGACGGALLLRHVARSMAGNLPEHPRDAFAAVIRVPEGSWSGCDHLVLGPSSMLWRRDFEHGLKVACMPFIEDPEELRFEVQEREAGRFYLIAPRNLAATRERVAHAVAALDASEAMLAVLPELTLSGPLLEQWQRALRGRKRGGSRLRWVLAGTGNLHRGRPPTNTAVLLNGYTGEVIARQEKLFPFSLTREILRRWQLSGRLGDARVDEDLARGDRLVVLEAGALRVAVLICEDLGRVTDLAGPVRDLGISHLLVPVFGRPLREHRWEHQRSEVYGQSTGTTAVIANSLVMRSILGKGDGTCLLVGPAIEQPLVGESRSATEVCSFVLSLDGTAVLA